VSPSETFRGRVVSEGIATGQLYLGRSGRAGARPPAPAQEAAGPAPQAAGPQTQAARPGETARGPAALAEVRAAFAAVAAERFALAAQLRADDRSEQAAIVEIGGLMAGDPALVDAAAAAVENGTDAIAAVTGAADEQAAILAALPSEDLAARADDVRQVGHAVVAQLTAGSAVPPPDGDFILVGREIDPADLIRLADAGLTGAISVSGGASSHSAIIARGLGLPMVAGVDLAVLDAPAGHPALLDATAPANATAPRIGRLVVDPDPADLPSSTATPPATATSPATAGPSATTTPSATAATLAPSASKTSTASSASPATKTSATSSASADTADPPVYRTADGQPVTLLVNAASAREVRMGLAAGAAGVGLLRTEIPFLGATAWPTRAEHEAVLAPPLRLLAGRPAVVRLLDFSGDKVPPFLAGAGHTDGLTSLLDAPHALRDQLRAILAAGRATDLRIMVPMVTTVAELAQVEAALIEAAQAEAARQPLLGMMVEVESTATGAAAFAGTAGFFSIGTNDLTSQVLGIDRADPRMRPGLAADPRVLAVLRDVVTAAADRAVPVSVCGDSAADPEVLPLLLGLGLRTFSVGAARLPQVAAWVAGTDAARAADQAAAVLSARPARPA
jgi:phosphoenolpyruvate-protein kinase (PTS system EI component)